MYVYACSVCMLCGGVQASTCVCMYVHLYLCVCIKCPYMYVYLCACACMYALVSMQDNILSCNNYYNAILYIYWQTFSYQMTFITDYQASYAVFTYQCPGNIPFYSPAVIGWGSAPNLTEFRYSQTNYSSRIACNEEGYYSLLINIEPPANEGQQKKVFNSNGGLLTTTFITES